MHNDPDLDGPTIQAKLEEQGIVFSRLNGGALLWQEGRVSLTIRWSYLDLPCPHCEGLLLAIYEMMFDMQYVVVCQLCQRSTPRYQTESEMLAHWHDELKHCPDTRPRDPAPLIEWPGLPRAGKVRHP